MKKALAILLAIGMVFAVFADEPVVSNSVVDFTGSASLEWISDLEAETNGFKNSTEAKLKIDIVTGGDKSTSGDGIWGELKIKVDGTSVENGKITLAEKKLEDLNSAVAGKLGIEYLEDDDGKPKKNSDDKYEATIANTWAYPAASVETAKIHFVDGDVAVALNILKPSLKLGKNAVAQATGSETLETIENDLSIEDGAGFGLELATSIVDGYLKVMDNGVAAEKEWGFAAGATIKPIDGLKLDGAFAYNTIVEETAMRFGASYKLSASENLYVKPAVDFTMYDETKALAAGVLVGWGADGIEAKLDYVGDKCADGVSFAVKTDLADEPTTNIVIGFFDSTFVDGLKVGADYVTTAKDFGEGTAQAAAKYGTDIDIISLSFNAGVKLDLAADTNTFKYGAEVSTDDVIDNTKLYAKYEGEKDNKGKITVGAKIAF